MTAAVAGDVADRAPRRRVSAERIAGGIAILLLLAFGVYSLTTIDFSLANFQASIENVGKVIAQMDPISFPSFGDSMYLIGLTLGVVVLGTVVAAVISVPVAYLAAANTTPGRVRFVGRAIGVITRAVPDVVIAMSVSLMFAIGSTLPGIIAIGFHSIGMISKLFADAIEQIDEGPVQAIRAAGGSKAQQFWSGIVPQVLPSWIATVLHRFDINLRGSVILGWAGIGGLGYAMSVQFKRFPEGYGPGLGIAIIIFAMCVVAEIVSSTIRRSLLGVQPTGRGLGDVVVRAATRGRAPRRERASEAAAAELAAGRVPRRPWTAERAKGAAWAWIGVAVVALSVYLAHIDFGQVVWRFALPSLTSFWPPSLGAHTFADFAEALLITIEVAFAAALVSVVLSIVIGSFAARNVAPNGAVRGVMRTLLVIFRGVPELVLAILLIMITGLGNQAGVVALAFGGIGLLGKLIADSFEEVNAGPERALKATGATRGQVYAAATIPQGVPSLISNSLYLVDTNLRSAAILGVVGGGGVGFYLTQASGIMKLHGQVTTLVLMIFVVVLLVELLATWLRRVFK